MKFTTLLENTFSNKKISDEKTYLSPFVAYAILNSEGKKKLVYDKQQDFFTTEHEKQMEIKKDYNLDVGEENESNKIENVLVPYAFTSAQKILLKKVYLKYSNELQKHFLSMVKKEESSDKEKESIRGFTYDEFIKNYNSGKKKIDNFYINKTEYHKSSEELSESKANYNLAKKYFSRIEESRFNILNDEFLGLVKKINPVHLEEDCVKSLEIKNFKNTYKKLCSSLIEEAEQEYKEKISETGNKRFNTFLTEKEKRIFELKPNGDPGNIDDYDILIKKSDFKKNNNLSNIEGKIKKLDKKIESIISEEDLNKLKEYSLLGNFIFIKNIDSYLKTKEQIKNLFLEEKDKKDSIELSNFKSALNDLSSKIFEKEDDLENAKKDLEAKINSLPDDDKEEAEILSANFMASNKKGTSNLSANGSKDIKNLHDRLEMLANKSYASKEEAQKDLRNLQAAVSRIKNKYGDGNSVINSMSSQKYEDVKAKLKNTIKQFNS